MAAEESVDCCLQSHLYKEFITKLNNSNFDIAKEDIPVIEIVHRSNEDIRVFNKMLGCFIGLAVGDAVGGPYEFESRASRLLHPATEMSSGGSHKLKMGEWTDDTAMALCLAVSLICTGSSNQFDQLVRYNWWREKGYLSSRHYCFDIGNLTNFALKTFCNRKSKLFGLLNIVPKSSEDDLLITEKVVQLNGFSLNCGDEYPGRHAGNGSLMRLAPVPLFFYGMKEDAINAAALSSVTTHDDDAAVEACQFYTALIMAAVEGVPKSKILSEGFYETYSGRQLKTKSIIDIAGGSYKTADDSKISGDGYVVHSLEAALWSFFNDGDSFEKGVFLAINLGDDTDTTAAIYGQLAGATYGYETIPSEWRRNIAHLQAIMNITSWIFLCNKSARK